VLIGAVVPSEIARDWKIGFRLVVNSAMRPLWFAIPTFLTLLMMRSGGLDDPPGFMPVARILLAYGVFFSAGWFLYENVDLLETCQRHVWAQLTFCLLLIPFSMWYERGWNGSHNTTFFVRAGYHALFVWCLTFSLIGLFQRYLDRPIAKMRYLSDSSYFLYLVHMPVLIVVQLGLARVGGPPALKCFILLAVSVPVMLVMYHHLVRPTVIGLALNGRKYPREIRKIGGHNTYLP
jgi:glucan biosynthesis protein C